MHDTLNKAAEMPNSNKINSPGVAIDKVNEKEKTDDDIVEIVSLGSSAKTTDRGNVKDKEDEDFEETAKLSRKTLEAVSRFKKIWHHLLSQLMDLVKNKSHQHQLLLRVCLWL